MIHLKIIGTTIKKVKMNFKVRDMRKGVFITAIAVFIGSVGFAQVTILDTQAKVNAWTTTTVTGNLRIIGANITSLTGLDELETVTGYLDIRDNPVLPSLTGLGAITSLGELRVSNNSIITSLEGLGSFTSLVDLTIDNNPKLTSFNGLSNITNILNNVNIYLNLELTSLEGLEGLTVLSTDLSIYSNAVLSTLNGLENLTALGQRLLIGVSTLGSIAPNPLLTNFCAISQLVIGNNPQITTSEYFIVNNAYNPTHVQLRNSETCMTTIRRGDFTINTQTEINNLGFSLFTSIEGNLIISESTAGAITSLSGLTNITSIGGNLAILDNMALTSLEGLENLVALGGQLQIGTTNGTTTNSNAVLVDFCAISGLVSGDVPQITNASATNEYFVKFNAYNPTYTGLGNSEAASEESRDGCREFVPGTEPPVVSTNTFSKEEGYRLFPNPVSDVLFVKSESKITSITISNVSGQVVLKGNGGSIDVGGLSNGIYFARIVSGEKTVVEKFVKL